MKLMYRCLVLVFALYLIPASADESERIKGVAQFLLERANYNYVYLFEYRIKKNNYFQCYFPVTYGYASSGHLMTLLRSGDDVWQESIQKDINGLLNRSLALLIAESKPAVIEFISHYIELTQNLAIEIDGTVYPLDQLPVDAPQNVRDVVNRFFLLADPLNELTEYQTRLKNFTANINRKTGCFNNDAQINSAEVDNTYDAIKNIGEQLAGKVDEQLAVFKQYQSQLRPSEKAQAKFKTELSKEVDKLMTSSSRFSNLVAYLKNSQPKLNDLSKEKNDVIKVIQVEGFIKDGIQAGTFPGSADFNSADYNRFKQYIVFFAEVSKAKSADQVKALLSEVTLPPVSFGLKRNDGNPRFFLSSYVGASSYWENAHEKGYKFGYGVFAPVGVEYVFLRWKGNSFSAMLAPFDFAHPLNLEIADQNKPVKFNDIVNPGVYLSWGAKELPLTIGVGYSKGRSLRSDSGDESRYLMFVAFDLPLFTLY